MNSVLLLVRHGESLGNVAREEYESAGADRIEIDTRDADVELSELGRGQAEALGRWLAETPSAQRPTLLWASPYLRARQTAEIAVSAWQSSPTHIVQLDERLRDRELGVLDRLTKKGVETKFRSEAERRATQGKFYYRPPGGESWADVVLRLRCFVSDERYAMQGGISLIVAHDAVVLLLRYILERFDEATLLDIARSRSVGNASITRLTQVGAQGAWTLDLDNYQQHLLEHGAIPTAHEAEHDVDPK